MMQDKQEEHGYKKIILRKIKSENGASVIIGLLLFIVCTVVSSSVLAASIANRVRLADEKQRQQESLNMESMLGVLLDGIGEIMYYRTWTEKNDSKQACDQGHAHDLLDEDLNPEGKLYTNHAGCFFAGEELASQTLKEQLKKMIERAVKEQTDNTTATDFRFSLSLDYRDGDRSLTREESKMYVYSHMDADKQLIFDLQEKQEEAYKTRVRIILKPNFQKYVDSETTPSWDSTQKCFVSHLQYKDRTPEDCNARYDRYEQCITWDSDNVVIEKRCDF